MNQEPCYDGENSTKITLWEFFQQLGKTFMLPVALLSFCGIMLGIGQLAKQSRCFDSAAVAGYAAAAGHLLSG
ncbi:PTS system protein [Klebsiella pneumoniae]|uniref:PTS system protein n=1 Tax=Klebsiella pneumoniae TaxID=573 RepID=A0A2X3CAE1_KLEPN|nr:PTS system protein [Klebsiella pneumoniae]